MAIGTPARFAPDYLKHIERLAARKVEFGDYQVGYGAIVVLHHSNGLLAIDIAVQLVAFGRAAAWLVGGVSRRFGDLVGNQGAIPSVASRSVP